MTRCKTFSCMLAVAICTVFGGTCASAAVMGSATIAVSATVLARCTRTACAAATPRTEQVVAFSGNSGGTSSDPAPAAVPVRQMLVITY